MAFDLDDEELEMTRVKLHHLEPRKTGKKDVKNEEVDKFKDLSSNNLKEEQNNGK